MQPMPVLEHYTATFGISPLSSHWPKAISVWELQSKLQAKAITQKASKYLSQS